MFGQHCSLVRSGWRNRCRRCLPQRIFQVNMCPSQGFAKTLGGKQHRIFYFVGCLRLLPRPQERCPPSTTVWEPSASAMSEVNCNSGSDSGLPVLTLLITFRYGNAGDTSIDTGSPAEEAGVTLTSMMLSLSTTGDMVVWVPGSTWFEGNNEASTITLPRIRQMPFFINSNRQFLEHLAAGRRLRTLPATRLHKHDRTG